jgi:hypothetical protein
MTIEQRIIGIQAIITQTLESCGRGSDDLTLVAVTKTHPGEDIEIALNSGIKHFGENKVQEAIRKVPLLTSKYDGFHFIGHLQSNKINQLLSLKPCLIHSVDSVYLAQKLHQALGRTNRFQDILIQINSSEEDSKSGLSFTDVEEAIVRIAQFSTLCIRGLMTIGKLAAPEASRPLFHQMKELFDSLKAKDLPGVNMDYLSMGMSHDYTIALEEGANLIRIGSAIFGDRNPGGIN